MFKKIDKLIAQSFFGLFFLTFSVVLFILLMVFMSKYFEDLVGKDLGFDVLGELFFYFSLTLVPQALPLAMLLSSLMAFGSMGEHNELTAIKGSGISLVRILFPVGVFAVFLTLVAYIFNDKIVPEVNLKAYRLMYDVRQKQPTVEFPEGSFYNGLPGWSIRIGKKIKGTDSIKDLMIYDHRDARGNTDVIIGTKGIMRNVPEKELLELYVEDGYRYSEQANTTGANKEPFIRDKFDVATFNFDLSFLNLGETSEELFKGNRYMMNISQLNAEADSLYGDAKRVQEENAQRSKSYFDYVFFTEFERERIAKREANEERIRLEKDSLKNVQQHDSVGIAKNDSTINQNTIANEIQQTELFEKDSTQIPPSAMMGRYRETMALNQGGYIYNPEAGTKKLKSSPQNVLADLDSVDWANLPDTITVANQKFTPMVLETIHDRALTKVRNMRSFAHTNSERADNFEYNARRALLEKNKRYSLAVACFIMFLIGAPLGAIIKKGGLGVPVLISIVFFILFYIITITGDKWAREKVISIFAGSWAANILLFVVGVLFLLQARADSRLFEVDAYLVAFDKVKRVFIKKKDKKVSES